MNDELLNHITLTSLHSILGIDHSFLKTIHKICVNKAKKFKKDKGYEIHLICVEEVNKYHNLKLSKRMRELRSA